jgi:hypothetical protein
VELFPPQDTQTQAMFLETQQLITFYPQDIAILNKNLIMQEEEPHRVVILARIQL